MTYNEFIQNIIDTRGQWNIPEGEHYENHHIVPRCMGGAPSKYRHETKHENLIWLYPEEHYRAHELLVRENPQNFGLLSAWEYMSGDSQLTESEYKELKENLSKLKSEKYKLKGNPHYGIHTNYNSPGFSGHKHSIESRDKIKLNNKWRILGTSNRAGCKISDKQIEAIREGFNKIENWHEINIKSRQKRKELGTESTTPKPVINLTTKEIFRSVHSAGVKYGRYNVKHSLEKNIPDSNGYLWSYLNE